MTSATAVLQFATRNRNVLFWQIQCVCWSGTVPVIVMAAANYHLSPQHGLVAGICRALIGALVTGFLLRPGLRGVRTGRLLPVPAGAFLFFTCIVVAFVETLATREIMSHFVPTMETASIYLAASTGMRVILYVFWCCVYLGITYWLDTQATHLRLARLETENRTAELQQLRAQVNPHFLFNALNSIQAEADKPTHVLAMTQGLAEYLRSSLHRADGTQTLREEFQAVEHYLRVESFRFENRLQYEFRADDDVRDYLVPGATVQPLVENAIKYGQLTSPLPLQIFIRAKRAGTFLELEVANSGHWVDPDPSRGGGIGLSNLSRRLELQFGGRASIDIEKNEQQVRILLRLPAEKRRQREGTRKERASSPSYR